MGKGRMAAVVRPRIFVRITVWAAVAPKGRSIVLTFSPDCPIGGLVLRRGICQALLAIKVGAMLRAPRWRIYEGINVTYDRGVVGMERVLEHRADPTLRGSILGGNAPVVLIRSLEMGIVPVVHLCHFFGEEGLKGHGVN